MESGEVEQSIRYYRDSLVLDDTDSTKAHLGLALLGNQQNEEAYEIFNSIKSITIQSNIGLGISRILTGQDLPKAISLIMEFKHHPDYNIDYFIGLAHHNMGKHNAATADFRWDLSHWQGNFALGMQYYLMQSSDLALQYFLHAKSLLLEENEKNSIQDSELILKNIDYYVMFIENQDLTDRVDVLKKYLRENKTFNGYITLSVLIHELEGYTNEFAKAIKGAKKLTPKKDVEIHEQLDTWINAVEV